MKKGLALLGWIGVGLVTLIGCGGGDGGGGTKTPNDVKTTSGSQAAISAFAKRDDSGKVDKIGPSDGNLKPDGKMDVTFDLTIKGPVIAILVDSADDDKWQWDTYTKLNDIPADMKAFAPGGALTGAIGVYEGDKLLNNEDGSFGLKDDAEHKLTIYIADTGAFVAGAKFKVYAETADHKVLQGPTVTF